MTSTYNRFRGFTLVELLIVLSITMLATALVGGMTLDSVKKYQRKAEILELQQIFKKASDMAFIDESPIDLTLQGNKLVLSRSGAIKQEFQFEYIRFNGQVVNINLLGVLSASHVTLVTDSVTRQVSIAGG